MKNEKLAINVKQEAAYVFYREQHKLSKRIKRKVSLEMLSEIFMVMVVPAIDEVRRIDREYQLDTGED